MLTYFILLLLFGGYRLIGWSSLNGVSVTQYVILWIRMNFFLFVSMQMVATLD